MRTARLLVAGVVCLLAATAAAAREGGGAVTGWIADQTGGRLAGVIVTLRNTDGQSSETISDETGTFRFDALAPGRYLLAFTLIDFAIARRANVDVRAGQTTHVGETVLPLSLNASVTVTARRSFRNLAQVETPGASLVGIADSASQGVVTAPQLEARPLLRAGEVVESVPGLIVSQHSGEGKANQFYLRGFNLDHGTDFSATVAGVPVNMPTHAHGQGYLDLNFLIPELVSGVQFAKGPYFAEEGDFSAAGAAHINYVNRLDAPAIQASGGDDGWRRAFAAASPRLAGGHLLAAVELNRNDGPWERGDGYRRRNGVLRYTRGDSHTGWSLTGMTYEAAWDSTDQVPERAVAGGRLSRFGAIDASNGGQTYRHTIAFDWQRSRRRSLTRASGYVLGYGVDLFSNFTYFLGDPDRGDQFEQVDRRITSGVDASHAWHTEWAGRAVEHRAGVQLRNDRIGTIGLHATRARVRHQTIRLDRVDQSSGGVWGSSRIHWADWLRTTVGVRADGYRFRVDASHPENGGRDTAGIVSPKLSLAFGPWHGTEWYVNAGHGFHSNDARGATITVDPRTGAPANRASPLVRARGAEVGFRTLLIPKVETTLALWRLDLDSELLFVGDAGTTKPGRPSHRHGIEWSAYASLRPWLSLDAELAWSTARFEGDDPAGDKVPGSVGRVASLGVAIDRDRTLFGGFRWRYLGPRPLVEDASVRSQPASFATATAGIRLSKRLAVVATAFNLFDSRASDIDYFYRSRLPGEPREGVEDVHTHPVVPRTFRLALEISY